MVLAQLKRRAGFGAACSGFVKPGFEPVRQAFAAQLARGDEQGGAVAVTHAGETVVDLWGGYADRGGVARRSKPWQRETLSVVFSATKGLAALVLLRLHEQGAFTYGDKVAAHWPGFAAEGKGDITIGMLLNHRAGLPAIDVPLSMDDVTDPVRWPGVVRALEAQRPLWTPGSKQAYHAVSYGLFAAELVRRVAPGLDISSYFQEHVATPLAADAWLGAPEEVDRRVATLYPPKTGTRVRGMVPFMVAGLGADGHVGRAFLTPDSLVRRTFLNPVVEGGDIAVYNRTSARRSALLWASGVANARALARIYAPLANGGEALGVRLVDEASLQPLYQRQSWSTRDLVLGKPLGWSYGFLKEETHVFCPHAESFGHAGMGGSLGWADPVARVSFGYVTNSMDWHVRSPRCIELCRALYASPAMHRSRSDLRE